MKYFIILLSSFLLFIIQVNAKEKVDQIQSIEILIKEIKNSSSDDRRVAMNKLKMELRTMNAETRKKVMLDLQSSFTKNNTEKQKAHNRTGVKNGSQHSMQGQQQGVYMQRHAPMRKTPAATPMRSTPSGGHR